ncbi:hypothetical protein HanRHA438_Chr08g0369841 [Helianthus annuus]|nr:hypothetical protein HanRHA438_Chr08g0369841 [Helianthus annuus]
MKDWSTGVCRNRRPLFTFSFSIRKTVVSFTFFPLRVCDVIDDAFFLSHTLITPLENTHIFLSFFLSVCLQVSPSSMSVHWYLIIIYLLLLLHVCVCDHCTTCTN